MSVKLLLLALSIVSLSFSKFYSQEIKLLSDTHNDFFSEHENELWVASTSKGYNRFDGISTYHYLLNDSISGLEGTYIQSPLISDSKGVLWTTTYERLCFFDQKHNRFDCRQLIIDNKTSQLGYHIFHIDKDDRIWMRTDEQIVLYDITEGKVVSILGTTKGNSFSMKGDTIIAAPWLNDKGFEAWIGRNDSWESSKHMLTQCLNYSNLQILKSLWVDENLWILSNEGLILYDFNNPCLSQVFKHPQFGADVLNDFQHYGSYILIGSDSHGIQVFDINKKLFINSIKTKWYDVDYVFSSSGDKLFYVNYNSGLSSLLYKEINGRFELINELQEDWKRILKDKQDLYLVSLYGELIKFSLSENKLSKISTDISDAAVFDERFLIAATKYSLFIINKENGQRTNIPHSWTQFQSMRILDNIIYVVADNTLYIYSRDSYNLMKETLVTINQYKIQELGTLSRNGIPYSFDGTLINIGKNGKNHSYDVGEYVNDLVVYPKINQIFTAANNGLFSLEIKNDSLRSKEVIASNKVFSSLVPKGQDLYFTTDSRIGKYNIPEQTYHLSRYIDAEKRPAFLIDGDSIYIATDHVAKYALSEFFEEAEGELMLSEFKINNESAEISPDSELKLSHAQNKISWSASIDHWVYADLASIEYQLLPDQEDWLTVENHSTVELPRLLPNDYTLNIRGTFSTGNESEVKSYKIKINEPWQNTAIAKFCFALLLGMMFYGLYRFRLQQLTEKNNIKEEIRQLEKSALQAQMNPHFIFNCLNSIQSFIMDNEKGNAMDYLGRFAQLIRSNLNASMAEKISLHDEIRILENYLCLEQLRLNHKFQFTITPADDIDVHETLIPPMLIQPFVENAVIHGMRGVKKEGVIEVSFTQSKAALNVSITDNGQDDGQNIPKDPNHKSVGVKITKKRLAHINQTSNDQVNVTLLKEASGTTVQLTIAL